MPNTEGLAIDVSASEEETIVLFSTIMVAPPSVCITEAFPVRLVIDRRISLLSEDAGEATLSLSSSPATS